MSKSETKSPSIRLSVSSVETFQSCKAKWYYRYIEGLPTPPNYHLTAGSFIHKILEIFLRSYKKHKDLKKAAKNAFALAKKDPELKEHLTEEILLEGREWLKFIAKKYHEQPDLIPDVLKIECPFTFKIDGTNITVRGFIDRIDNTSKDSIEIIDYKTSSNPDYLKPLQLATYSIAASKKYPGKKITAAYQLVRHQFENKHFPITEKVKQEAIETFKEAAKEITHLKNTSPNIPWEANVTRLCDYCPFRVRCEQDRKKLVWSTDE